MIYSISGEITAKDENFAVIEAGGVGYKVFAPRRTLSQLPPPGGRARLVCHFHMSQDNMSLYGFVHPSELSLFELLISVSGVGPRSALSVINLSDFRTLAAAISEGRADLLTRAAGVGQKTAERIIVELRNKVAVEGAQDAVSKMESDRDLVETLMSLGYRRDEAKRALSSVPENVRGVELRLKAAFKVLQGEKR